MGARPNRTWTKFELQLDPSCRMLSTESGYGFCATAAKSRSLVESVVCRRGKTADLLCNVREPRLGTASSGAAHKRRPSVGLAQGAEDMNQEQSAHLAASHVVRVHCGSWALFCVHQGCVELRRNFRL